MKQPGKELVFFQGADLQLKLTVLCLVFNLMLAVLTALSGGSQARPRGELLLLLQGSAPSQGPSVRSVSSELETSPSSPRVHGRAPSDVYRLQESSPLTQQLLLMAQSRLKLFLDQFSLKVESSRTVTN